MVDSGMPDSAQPDAATDAGMPDSSMHDAGGHEPDAGMACEYPVIWAADPTTQGVAETDLAELVPGASPTWDARRGTFTSIYNMDVPLDCPAGGDVWTSIIALIEAHPTIFRIDLREWETPVALPCSVIGALVNFARLNRSRPIAHDFANFGLVRVDGQVRLQAFVSSYLPIVPASVVEQMASCGELTVALARPAVEATTFPYSTFVACAPTGSGEYTALAADTVELDAEAFWTWVESDAVSGVELTKQHFGRLLIHADNVTPVLQSSDVNCPDEVGDGRTYGFRIIFDAVRREILSTAPGLGCLVC